MAAVVVTSLDGFLFFVRLFKNRIFLTFCALPRGTAPRPGGSFGGLAAGFSKSCVCLSSASFAFLRHSGRNPSSFFCVWISSLSLFFVFSFVCRTSGIFYFCRRSSSPCARFSSLPLLSFVSPVCRYFFIFQLFFKKSIFINIFKDFLMLFGALAADFPKSCDCLLTHA